MLASHLQFVEQKAGGEFGGIASEEVVSDLRAQRITLKKRSLRIGTKYSEYY